MSRMREHLVSAVVGAAIFYGASAFAQSDDEDTDAALLASVNMCIAALEDGEIVRSDFETSGWMPMFFGMDEKRSIQRGVFFKNGGGSIITQAKSDGSEPVCSTYTTRKDVTREQLSASLSARFEGPKKIENNEIWKHGDLAIILGKNEANNLAIAVLRPGEL